MDNDDDDDHDNDQRVVRRERYIIMSLHEYSLADE